MWSGVRERAHIDSLQLVSILSVRGTIGVAPVPGLSTTMRRMLCPLASGSGRLVPPLFGSVHLLHAPTLVPVNLSKPSEALLTLWRGKPPRATRGRYEKHGRAVRVANVGIRHGRPSPRTPRQPAVELEQREVCMWICQRGRLFRC